MKKLIIILILSLAGCSSNDAPLGADKVVIDEKLESVRQEIIYSKEITNGLKTYVRYHYTSDESVNETVISREGSADFSNTVRIDNNTLKFYGADKFWKDGNDWKKIKRATTTLESFNFQVVPDISFFGVSPVYGLSTTTYTTNKSDGRVGIEGTAGNWAAAHGASTGGNLTDSEANIQSGGTFEVGGNAYIYRGFYAFDTSVLPTGAVISSSSLSFYIASLMDGDSDAQGYVAIVQGFQADPVNLAVGDYEDCGSDNGTAGRAKETPQELMSDTTYDITGLATTQWINYLLNSDGLASIADDGYTKFCGREGHDLENVQWAGSGWSWASYAAADAGSNIPFIIVEYTVVSEASLEEDGVIFY